MILNFSKTRASLWTDFIGRTTQVQLFSTNNSFSFWTNWTTERGSVGRDSVRRSYLIRTNFRADKFSRIFAQNFAWFARNCTKISTEFLKVCERCAKINPRKISYFRADEVRENLFAWKLVRISRKLLSHNNLQTWYWKKRSVKPLIESYLIRTIFRADKFSRTSSVRKLEISCGFIFRTFHKNSKFDLKFAPIVGWKNFFI